MSDSKNIAQCVACEKTRHCEVHHILPRRHGGKGGVNLVPLCVACHDAVDRLPLSSWDPTEAACGLARLWGALDLDSRLLLLKGIAVMSSLTQVEE